MSCTTQRYALDPDCQKKPSSRRREAHLFCIERTSGHERPCLRKVCEFKRLCNGVPAVDLRKFEEKDEQHQKWRQGATDHSPISTHTSCHENGPPPPNLDIAFLRSSAERAVVAKQRSRRSDLVRDTRKNLLLDADIVMGEAKDSRAKAKEKLENYKSKSQSRGVETCRKGSRDKQGGRSSCQQRESVLDAIIVACHRGVLLHQHVRVGDNPALVFLFFRWVDQLTRST